jgi:hypothetical protein
MKGLLQTGGGLVSGSIAILSSAASGAARATAAAVPDDFQVPDMSASDIGMSDLPPSIQDALRKHRTSKQNFKAEAQQMFRSPACGLQSASLSAASGDLRVRISNEH